MYRLIVEQLLRRGFRHLSAGDYEYVVATFAPDAAFSFSGDHALGGALRGREAVRGWFQRLFHLFPDFAFVPQTIAVSGWPWNTVAATRFRVRATLPDGAIYHNEGMQFLRLRWGRVVEDRLYEDTQLLAATLAALAEMGVAEALAPPLGPVSPPGAAPATQAANPA